MSALALGFIVFVFDQMAKTAVLRSLTPGQRIPVFPGLLDITNVRNPGAAFGILPHRSVLFVSMTFLILVVIGWFLLKYPRPYSRQGWGLHLALGLTLGGAAGNLVDRLRFGFVVDFLDIHFWPVFNLADIAIVIGAALIGWFFLRHKDVASRGAGDGSEA